MALPPSSDNLPTRVVGVTEKLLTQLGFEATISCRDRRTEHPPHIWVDIVTEESGLLIGEHGTHLRALEHILRLLLRTELSRECRCYLDINTYRLHRMEFLKRLARESARRVVDSHRAVTLEPMSAMDRRIVHLALTGEALVETSSVGQEPERRVVIRPRDPFLTPEQAVEATRAEATSLLSEQEHGQQQST